MIKFNPENKAELTVGECLKPAMEIKDKDEAMQYLRDYSAYIADRLSRTPGKENEDAVAIARHNLGYWAGYYDKETQIRVQEIFNCIHPIFGKASYGDEM